MADIISNNGVISAQNTVPAGVAPANSAVELEVAGVSSLEIQTVGTYTGALSLQGTIDGQTWVTLGGTPLLNENTGVYSATIASGVQGIFQASVASFTKVRLTALAAVTGSATVNMKGTRADGMFVLGAPLPTGANTIGAVTGTVTITQPSPSAINVNSAATTNSTSAKATAGSLFELTITNMSAAPKFVKFYNKATAPTVGTDVPVMTLEVAANASRAVEFGANGKRFTTGIGFAITGAQPIADTTAVAAGDVQLHGSYV